MRYVTFFRGDGRACPGVIDGEAIRVIDAPTLRDFIALPAQERAASLTAERVDLASVRLDAPVRPCRNVFCIGRNYVDHVKEGARAAGRDLKLPQVPVFFTKATRSIAAAGATLHLEAAVSQEYDYEAELAAVIGTTCKDISEQEWRDPVFGYTCLNDVTARDLQRAHGQWFKGKSLDDACPLGPWIVSADEITNPGQLEITFRLTGVQKQKSNTSQMIFGIPRIIAELSKGMTLEPGDVIATGTPDGVGFARRPPEFLRDGDEMEVEIEGIGCLTNRVSIV